MYCVSAVDLERYKRPAKNVLIEGVLGCRNLAGSQAAKNGIPNRDTDTQVGKKLLGRSLTI
jgi:hypothetical protein